jgi:hypothetical protein
MSDNSNSQLCPVCGSGNSSLLYKVNSSAATKHFVSENDTNRILELTGEIEKIWEEKTAEFRLCNSCTFKYAVPFKAGSHQFYSIAYSGSVYYPTWKWDYEITLQSILNTHKKHDNTNTHVLEVGAGNGVFVKRISKELIPAKNILCTEYSEYGRNEINKEGISCMGCDVTEIPTNENKNHYNIICMFQVLEHMEHIDDAFQSLNQLSAPNAELFITVPNDNHRNFYDNIGEHLDLPPTHISRWNKKSMTYMANKYGWELISHKYEKQSFIFKLRHLLVNRYHNSSSHSRIEQIQSHILKKFALLTILSLICLRYCHKILLLLTGNNGVSQWFYLRKTT